MGNVIEKYYKKDDNTETASYFIRLGKKLYIGCPSCCHLCLGYLENERYSNINEDIETGPIIQPAFNKNTMEDDYDIPAAEEFI